MLLLLLSCFSHVQLVQPHRWQPTRLLHPWDSPGKNTGVSCHFLLQGIFLTQGLNPGLLSLLQRQMDSLPLSHLGTPSMLMHSVPIQGLHSLITFFYLNY